MGKTAVLMIRSTALAAVATTVVAAGCASFDPQPIDEFDLAARSETKKQDAVSVTAAVLSAEESARLFGVNLYRNGIQPVRLEIINGDTSPMVVLPGSTDPEYLTPLEVAAMYRFSSAADNEALDRVFSANGLELMVPPGEVRSGFLFTNLDEGTKQFVVELIGADQEFRRFMFFIEVPGLHVDHRKLDFNAMYDADELIHHDLETLRRSLEELPCCTSNKSSKGSGDPLNLVVVGEPIELYHAFIRAGWDETETIYTGSLLKTARSFAFGSSYRYSPVSALYVFGRGQDVALQKARDTIHERNHLRLWMTPLRLDGKPVWIGQISRDIGVRYTRKTITTHKIDPDVDEARNYLLQDLWYSQGLAAYAYVAGVEEAAYEVPRSNLTGDPYFTDGLRAVMWISGEPRDMEEVRFVEWENPPGR